MEPIRICMLGEFSLTIGSSKICDSDNRSKKIWILLSYLICNRGRVISPKNLIELLWGDVSSKTTPENTLKVTFHRVRTMLDQLYPSAGHQLIVHRESGYMWCGDAPVILDIDEFDQLISAGAEDPDCDPTAYLKALALYKGDFLEKLSSENWVIPIATHYHNLYVQAVLQVVPRLSQRGRHQEAATVCRRAIAMEPYHEQIYQLLMGELAAMRNPKEAAVVYEELSRRLFDDFGIMPGDETRAAYRKATQSLNDHVLPMETVLEQLHEQTSAAGALQCDYDFFKVLCYAEARAMERSGKATHIALLSISPLMSRKTLSKRSLDRAMEHLAEEIRVNLRRGDSFSRCSATQYIVMLPQANYENSCMVCRRVIAAFSRKHPSSPVKINYMVQALSSRLPLV